jgi:DNA-binding GntR family transcriptional regulator
MADEPFPDDVRDYILNHIDSIAQLEALLLLRAHPDESWDVVKMARRLYVSEPEVSDALGRLVSNGIVSFEEDSFAYQPSPEMRDLIERVTATYRRHLIAVTNLIHSKPSRIHQFADAFKFRRDR